MVAGEREAPAAAERGPAHHVRARPVVLDEVHVHRREMRQRMAEVAAERDRLEEDLGQKDRRAEIDIYAAFELSDERAEALEVAARRLAGRPRVKGRMHVDDVRPDGDMHGHRDAQARACRKKALVLVGEIAALDQPAHGFSDAEPLPVPVPDRVVDHAAGLFGHAEGAGQDLLVHVLGCLADERELEVVDDAGAVQRQGGDDPALHEIDDHRREADLDGMGPHAEHHGPLVRARLDHGRGHFLQMLCAEDPGKAGEEVPEGAALPVRRGKLVDPHLAGAALEGVGPEPRGVEAAHELTVFRRRASHPPAGR